MSKAEDPAGKVTTVTKRGAAAKKPAATRARKPAAKAAKAATEGVSEPAPKTPAAKAAAPRKTAARKPAAKKTPAAVKAAPEPAMPVKADAAAETVMDAVKPAEEAVVAAAEIVEESVAAATEVAKEAMETVKTETEKAVTATMKQASAAAKAAAVKSYPPVADTIDNLFEMQRSAFDAWMTAGSLAAKSIETLGEDIAAFNQSTLDATVKNGEQLLACKTLQDVVELQSDFASKHLSACLDTGQDLSDKAMKMAAEIAAPLETQVKKAMEAARAS